MYFSAAKGESSVFRYFPRSANEPILCGSAFIRYSIVAMYRLSSSTCVPNPAAIIFLFACCQRRAPVAEITGKAQWISFQQKKHCQTCCSFSLIFVNFQTFSLSAHVDAYAVLRLAICFALALGSRGAAPSPLFLPLRAIQRLRF